MLIAILVFCTLAMFAMLVYVVIRMNELEKELNAFIARVMDHYEAR